MYNAGDFQGTETVMIPFNTFSSNDPSASVTVTDFANTDVYIYKDASLTERSSSAGVAVDIDVETGTGSHWVSIDLSDNTDVGFYASGSQFIVRIEGVTVDAGTLNAWIGGFSIGKMQTAMTAALVAANLDHLALTATGGADMTTEVADNTILSRILANGDTSAFVPSTDGLQPIRDHIGDGTNLTEAGATGNHLSAIPWNGDWDAEVQSEVSDALIAINLDHLALTATVAADMTAEVADNTILSRIIGNGDTSAFVPSTDGLQLIRDKLTDIETDTDVIDDGTSGLVKIAQDVAAILVDTDVIDDGTSGLVKIAQDVAAILVDTTGLDGDAMRGTDSAALASVVGALTDAAAAGEVTTSDTLMQYLKQLINILIGAAGIGTFPAEAAPANAVSLAEVIRAIHADVTGLNGSAMIGTNSAALASVCTEGRLAELDAANIPSDVDAIKAKTDNLPGSVPKNVALNNFPIYMVDLTNGYTAETGLTVSATISKDGGALTSCENSVTEISNGLYKINLTQAEMNADTIILGFTATGARARVVILKTDA